MRFADYGKRVVFAAFDGGEITSDAGVLLLREQARRIHLFERMAGCFTDHRDRERRTHALPALLALKPADKSWIAWDDRLTGFGVRVHPTGAKSFIVNYRSGDGGRKAPNKRVVIGRYGKVAPDQARRLAQKVLGKVASGDDPAEERAEARAMPTLGDAFEDYMGANPNRSKRTDELYRYEAKRYLGDWLSRPLDAIARRDVEARFNRITEDHGWSPANRAMSLLRSVYRRPCVDLEGLRNPVDLWLSGGGKFHRKVRRKISTPAEVLPCWRAGIEAEVNNPAIRDALWFGLYTGMRRDEVLTLRWERGGHGGDHLPGRGNKNRRSLGASRHPAVERYPETPLSRKR